MGLFGSVNHSLDFFFEMTGCIPNRGAGRPDHWHQGHALCNVGRVSQLSHHAFDDTNVSVQETSEAATVYGIQPHRMWQGGGALPDNQSPVGL